MWGFFDPHYLNKVKPQSIALTTLSVFPFAIELLLSDLKQEFPLYVADAENISSDCKTLMFWKQHANNTSRLKEAVAKIGS